MSLFTDLAVKYCKSLLNEINEYVPMDYPTRPEEVVKFDACSEFERRRQVENGFWEQSVAKDYLNKKWEAEKYNTDMILRLHELLMSNHEWPRGSGLEPLGKQAIGKKLTEFKDKILRTSRPYKSLMIDFKKFPFSAVEEPDVAEAMRMWEGGGDEPSKK